MTNSRKGVRHVVSVSGGKDSAATLLIAMQRFPREKIIPIFCDTGNEHHTVYEYLSYLEQALDIEIVRLKADFTERIAAKRMFIARDQRTRREYDTAPVFDAEGNPVQKRNKFGSPVCNRPVGVHTRAKTFKRLGIAPIHRFIPADTLPTDNRVALIDQVKLKLNSRVPLQFLGAELPLATREPALPDAEIQEGIAGRMKSGKGTAFCGIRPAHPAATAHLAGFLDRNEFAILPFLEDRTAEKVFDLHRQHRLQPNPLYRQGMGRVGCMPCHNVGKDELRQISARFPEYLEQKAEWESIVSLASKRGFSTFFNKELHEKNGSDRRVHEANRITEVIRWAHTSRGGRQLDMLAAAIEPSMCSSAYGLCDGATA